jgi:hypothetical protein
VRLPRHAAVVLTAALALVAGGCGGSDVEYEEAPGPPAVLTVPEGASSLSADATPEADASATATPTAAAETPAGTTSEAGAAAPAATPTPAATAAPQSGGTDAPAEDSNEFDAFCNENPGACD